MASVHDTPNVHLRYPGISHPLQGRIKDTSCGRETPSLPETSLDIRDLLGRLLMWQAAETLF